MKKIAIVIVLVVGIGVFLFTAFAKEKNDNIAAPDLETNALTESQNQAESQNPNESILAPDFSLPQLGGGTITLSDYRGNKQVILDFWASWCPNCRRDMPKLNTYYESYRDDVEVIGVNLGESENDASEFIASKNISFPIVLDSYGSVAQLYQMNYTNVHVLIDKDGSVVRVIPGDISEADVLSLIQ